MLLNIIIHCLTILARDAGKQQAADAACQSYSTVELVPSDKEAAKIKPEQSIVAEEMRSKGLVPIKSIVIFMRPDSEYPLCGMPENLLLIHKKLVEGVGESAAMGGANFTLIKGTLGNLIGTPAKPPAEEEPNKDEDAAGGEDLDGAEDEDAMLKARSSSRGK